MLKRHSDFPIDPSKLVPEDIESIENINAGVI
jgi:hypothetical protein